MATATFNNFAGKTINVSYRNVSTLRLAELLNRDPCAQGFFLSS